MEVEDLSDEELFKRLKYTNEKAPRCWIVWEVYQDGRTYPRAITTTPVRAEIYKRTILNEFKERPNILHPRIYIERSLLDHLFGSRGL